MADKQDTVMKPIPPSDDEKYYQQIVKFRTDPSTGFYALSCSTDNGLHYEDVITSDGFKFSEKAAKKFWPFLKKYVSSLIDGVTIEWAEVKGKPEVITKDQLEERLSKLAISKSFSWNDITDRPSDLVHEQALQDVKSTASSAKELAEKNASLLDNKADVGQIPKTMSWGNITEKPRLALESDIPSLDGYAKLSQIPSIDGLVREAELTAYAKHNELPVIPTDLVHSAELDKANADIAQAKQMANDAVALANNARTIIDTSNIHRIKKPSEYSEGFSYEVKALSDLGIDLTKYDTSVQNGWIGLVKSVQVSVFNSVYVTQTVRVLGSYRPTTFIRNGSGDSWYPFELVTTW